MPVLAGRLVGPVQPYAWGSRTAIAELQGRPVPADGPEAELWLGAHPLAPARLVLPDGTLRPLDAVITADPERTLGRAVLERFGPRLPFLLKVLAAEAPLSLQVHPSAGEARAGFAAEEAAGVAIDAPERRYRDPWPKPELLRALTPVDALCGFRDPRRSADLLDHLGVPALAWVRDELIAGPRALPGVVRRLMTVPAADRGALVTAVAAAAARPSEAGGPWADEARWCQQLAAAYPADPGVLVALLLELVHLEPGEAIHLPAGNLHAYLRGVGVEVMAASDNVLRGGLTGKHVDVDELLRVLDARVLPVPRVTPVVGVAGERVLPTPAPHFRLSELTPPAGGEVELDRRGPEVLLATAGEVTVVADGLVVALARGEAAFVAAAAATVRVGGRGALVFRATVGDPPG